MSFARLRFATACTTIGGGVLLGLGAVIFAAGTERWLGLAVGAALTIISIVAFATAGRGAFQRCLDVLLVPIALWALISARTIELAGHGASPSLVKWLGLSSGAAIFAVGIISLVAHELSLEADLRWALKELTEPADEESAEDAPPAHEPPTADDEPAAEREPAADDAPATDDAPAAEQEAATDDVPAADERPTAEDEPTAEPESAGEGEPAPVRPVGLREADAGERNGNRGSAAPAREGQGEKTWLTPVHSGDESLAPNRRTSA